MDGLFGKMKELWRIVDFDNTFLPLYGLAKGSNNPKWKGVEDETLMEAYDRHGSYAAVGKEVGLTRSQVRQRILKYKGEWLWRDGFLILMAPL